jgi:hypothetical protein
MKEEPKYLPSLEEIAALKKKIKKKHIADMRSSSAKPKSTYQRAVTSAPKYSRFRHIKD